mmetsp:Transcript_40654/g.96361  ORF Transcript_40654/g.96361 Transcript_40654/m.96361 type:complete len:274 (+) Transcript_40654:455-1276(+)
MDHRVLDVLLHVVDCPNQVAVEVQLQLVTLPDHSKDALATHRSIVDRPATTPPPKRDAVATVPQPVFRGPAPLSEVHDPLAPASPPRGPFQRHDDGAVRPVHVPHARVEVALTLGAPVGRHAREHVPGNRDHLPETLQNRNAPGIPPRRHLLRRLGVGHLPPLRSHLLRRREVGLRPHLPRLLEAPRRHLARLLEVGHPLSAEPGERRRRSPLGLLVGEFDKSIVLGALQQRLRRRPAHSMKARHERYGGDNKQCDRTEHRRRIARRHRTSQL